MLLLPLRLDLAPHLGHRLILYFNPRTPVRCDAWRIRQTGQRGISIHAPQWGATGTPREINFRAYFNPRPREGCDAILIGWMANRPYFNPRTP